MRALSAFAILALTATPAQAQPVFSDQSADLPPHVYAGGWEHFVGGGVAVFDCDGDGLPEVLAAGGDNPMALLRNQGSFRFAPGDFPAITAATGVYPLDLNADGWQDLCILRAGPDQLLQGGPDCAFSDITADLGLAFEDRWSTAFTAWWEPGDARPTLAVGHYVDRTDPEGPFEACDTNLILRPDGEAYRMEVLAPGFCPLSMLAAEDARGRLTLRVSNDRHYYVRGGSEQMWDIADRRFLGTDDGWDGPSLWGMGIASRDLTGDGRDEVMLTSMGDQLLQIATPQGGYVAAPYSQGTYATRPHTGGDGRPSTGWHAQFGDVDNDGLADLFIAKGNVDQMPGNAIADPNNLLMQQPGGQFVEAAAEAGVATTERSRGAALADLDGDGLLDLVVVNRRAPLELWRNETASAGNWLGVSLVQADGGNRDAIGATVTVATPDGRVQRQQVTVGGGHAGGQSVPLHFGLGAASEATITVRWPDGIETAIDAPAGAVTVVAR
ncbi:MAG: CRTAC1 family protein [Devosiaceae bacterium]|nr:CRTAC1 family protein [Devosiaceae bacterium MH13]